jgi:hypothetical protein
MRASQRRNKRLSYAYLTVANYFAMRAKALAVVACGLLKPGEYLPPFAAMTNTDFHLNIRRIRRLHWLQYPVQGLLMVGGMLGASGQMAVGPTLEPALTTWPVLLGLLALLPVVGGLLYVISRYLRPNVRRPAEENLRIYQGRVLLRNSLLGLLALPLLASYVIGHKPLDLVLCGAVLLALGWQTRPSAETYQRWLVA